MGPCLGRALARPLPCVPALPTPGPHLPLATPPHCCLLAAIPSPDLPARAHSLRPKRHILRTVAILASCVGFLPPSGWKMPEGRGQLGSPMVHSAGTRSGTERCRHMLGSPRRQQQDPETRGFHATCAPACAGTVLTGMAGWDFGPCP